MTVLVVVAMVAFGAGLLGNGTVRGQQSEIKKGDAVAPQKETAKYDNFLNEKKADPREAKKDGGGQVIGRTGADGIPVDRQQLPFVPLLRPCPDGPIFENGEKKSPRCGGI